MNACLKINIFLISKTYMPISYTVYLSHKSGPLIVFLTVQDVNLFYFDKK